MKTYEKVYVLDTNIILDNHTNLEMLSNKGENLIVLPATVLEEIDKFKSGFEEINFQARSFARMLYDAVITGNEVKHGLSLISTVVSDIGILIVDKKEYQADSLNTDRSIRNDSKIIEITEDLKEIDIYKNLIFLSLDIMARTRALGKGISTEALDLGFDEMDIEKDFHLEVTKNELANPFDSTMSSMKVLDELTGREEFLYKTKQNTWEPIDDKNTKRLSMPPLNFRQKTLVELILDENDIIIASGPAGTGKTVMAVSAAMKLMDLHKDKYTNIAYIRRTVISGTSEDELGFLPGDLGEKMAGYNQPMMSAVKKIAMTKKKSQGKEELEERIEKLNEQYAVNYLYGGHLRGDNLDEGTILIMDEVQNWDVPSIRTIISRAGKNNIIIAVGSNNQIDSKFLTKNNNALTFLINKCGLENKAGVNIKGVKLTNVLRSKIAEWADDELIQK